MGDCVEIYSSDDDSHHVARGSREAERIGISSASSSPQPPDAPVSANLRKSTQAINRARQKSEGQLRMLQTDPKFFANFNPETSRREKRKLTRKSTPLVVPKTTGIYNEKGVHRETGRDMCDCLDLGCPGCHFPCQCCGSAKCGPHCRVTRKWMYESIEHDAKDLVIRNKLMIKK